MRQILRSYPLSIALCVSGCSDAVDGNGVRASETRALDGFNRVESSGSVDVAIEQADSFGVQVSIDSNLLPQLRTRVIGETLVIDSRRDFEHILAGPHVLVSLPALRGATLSGSGALHAVVPQSSEPVDLRLSGSGDLAYTGSAPETNLSLSGSGNVTLAGSCDWVSLTLDGSGSIDAEQLQAGAGRLALSGSGDIRATSNGVLDIQLDGSGDVYLYGEPQLGSVSIDGSGQLYLP